jgi:hypothetical protein
VAHELANINCLPEDFNQFDLKDNKGVSVRDIVKKMNKEK